MKSYIYLDKNFDLPLIVTGSAREMAEKRGVKTDSIYQVIAKAKKRGHRCRYLVVEEEEEEA